MTGRRIGRLALALVTLAVAALVAPSIMPVADAQKVVATIPVGSVPFGVGVNAETNKVYVANFGSAGSGNTISVIDGSTNTVVATIGVGSGPRRVGVNVETNTVYVANSGSNTVSVIDGSTNTVVATVGVGKSPRHVAVNVETNTVYVANSGSNTVSVIDGSANTVVATIGVGSDPRGVAVNDETNMVYVTNFGLSSGNTVSVIDGSTNTVVATVVVGIGSLAPSVNVETNTVYVTNFGPAPGLGNTVSVIDGSTNTVVATIGVGLGPADAAVNVETNTVYVANSGSNTVSVIDGSTNTVVNTIGVGISPRGLGLNDQTNIVYVANSGSNSVSVIDGNNEDNGDSAAGLVLHIVAPHATDPAIDQALDNHYVWLDTTARSNHKLFVFMPGGRQRPAMFQLVEKEAARLGYHVIGLMYPNSVQFAVVCPGAPDPNACYENGRLEIVDGVHRSDVLNVNKANSIDNRLTKLLEFLAAQYPEEGWSRFLADGKLKWSQIVVSGHSQGGGEAAMIAKIRVVARVVLFSSVVDRVGTQAAPWTATHVTPSERYWGLAHDRDGNFPAIRGSWDLIGMAAFGPEFVAPEASEPPYGFTHMLVTEVVPIGGFVGTNAHGSPSNDAATPLRPDGTPILRDAWDYLMTAQNAGESGDHEADLNTDGP